MLSLLDALEIGEYLLVCPDGNFDFPILLDSFVLNEA